MRWPPNRAWTSTKKLEGCRHFQVKQFGGIGKGRWIELFPVLKKEIRIRVLWSELKKDTYWRSGWLQLPEEEDSFSHESTSCIQAKTKVE